MKRSRYDWETLDPQIIEGMRAGKKLVKLADELDIDYKVMYARIKGHGGYKPLEWQTVQENAQESVPSYEQPTDPVEPAIDGGEAKVFVQESGEKCVEQKSVRELTLTDILDYEEDLAEKLRQKHEESEDTCPAGMDPDGVMRIREEGPASAGSLSFGDVLNMDIEQSIADYRDYLTRYGWCGDKYEKLGREIGAMVDTKNAQYGDAFNQAGVILEVLYPDGVEPEQYADMLGVIRVIDKLFRIANGDQGGESAWRDIAGYGLLGEERRMRNEHQTA